MFVIGHGNSEHFSAGTPRVVLAFANTGYPPRAGYFHGGSYPPGADHGRAGFWERELRHSGVCTELTVSGYGIAGSSLVDVAALGLEFSSWPFGSGMGTVKPYGPPNYESAIEYTYFSSGLTYFNPILTGVASVPEPSSIVLSFAGMVGAVVLGCYNRRKTAA